MCSDNVTRFPIGGYQRHKNQLGVLATPCQVSDRWLQFSEYSDEIRGDSWMFVDVMTASRDGEGSHKLTSLCLSRKELLAALRRAHWL